jgi:hypothetical protein
MDGWMEVKAVLWIAFMNQQDRYRPVWLLWLFWLLTKKIKKITIIKNNN